MDILTMNNIMESDVICRLPSPVLFNQDYVCYVCYVSGYICL